MREKQLLTVLLLLFKAYAIDAQLSGTASVPGTYSSLGAALSDLNASGVSGPFTLNIAAGYSETVVPGGFSLTATGSPNSPITIRRSGSGPNPVLYAYAGNKTPGASSQDGFFRLSGCDHVLIDGLDLIDTNSSNPSTMEFGFGFFKADTNDGCHNNTIRNCRISLNRINTGSGSGPAGDGARGIELVNATASAHTTSLQIFSALGSHSGNKITGNVIENCNIGVALTGYAPTAGTLHCDHLNEISGNVIVNFGGGGTSGAASGIKCSAQQHLVVSGNWINSNDGKGVVHAATLRGIHLLDAREVSAAVHHNTITVHGGGTGSQLVAVLNETGDGGSSNQVSVSDNYLLGSSYSSATSGAFYGIWNNADPFSLKVDRNVLEHNSTGAASGNTYLLYNNGSPSLTSISENTLSYRYTGAQSYSGTTYGIYNSGAASGATISISRNVMRDLIHVNHNGAGNIYFINQSADCSKLSIDSNLFHDLVLSHDGPVYFMHNSSSAASLLSVCGNTINRVRREGTASHLYGYYATSGSPATAQHIISNNLLSQITATSSGTGNFYGIYNSAGNNSPYPCKSITTNTLQDIQINGTGNFYGIYATDLGGDTAASEVSGNVIRSSGFTGAAYGLYCAGPVSPSLAARVERNTVAGLHSADGAVYGAYLGSNNAGVWFGGNRVANISTTGTASSAYGLFGAGTTTSNIVNNMIGHVQASASSGANRSNGIYISSGQQVNLIFNTVLIQASSSGSNAGSNALYASSTASVTLNNNILVNKSATPGSAVAAAYRRSTSNMGSYAVSSDRNLFFTGGSSSSAPVFFNGSSYSNLGAMQSYAAPREANSISLDPVFVSTVAASPNYLHLQSFPPSAIESGGSAHPLASTDFDQQPRHGNSGYVGAGTSADIGADEFESALQPCNGVNVPTINVSSLQVCAGHTVALFSSPAAGADVVFDWQISPLPGGTFSSTGASGPEYQSPSLSAGVYYFRLVNTCTNSAQTAASAEVTVVVTAPPAPVIAAQTTVVCAGDSVTLSVSGPTNHAYHWFGPKGYTSWDQNILIAPATPDFAGHYSVVSSVNGCTAVSQPMTLSVSVASVTLIAGRQFLCASDTTLLSLQGSMQTFTWAGGSVTQSLVISPTVTMLYTVTAQDAAGCAADASVQVIVLSPTISAVNATVCGSQPAATLAVNAFTPSVVSWFIAPGASTSITTGNTCSLMAHASATLYAQAGGACNSSMIPVFLAVAPLPTLIATVSPDTVCPGSKATLIVKGASSYTWTGMKGDSSAAVTPSATTQYTVKGALIPGCTASIQIKVFTYSVPSLSIQPSSNAVCPSARTTLTAGGAASYTWSTGSVAQVVTVTPAAASVYTLYGHSAEGCMGSSTIAITTKSVPAVYITATADSLCPGEPVPLTAGGAVSYTWLPGMTTGNTATVYPLTTSVFNVIGMAANSCTQAGIVLVNVQPCTALAEIVGSAAEVYPNPSSSHFVINCVEAGEKRILLYDYQGRLIKEDKFATASYVLQMDHLPQGVYFVRIALDERSHYKKLIRQ